MLFIMLKKCTNACTLHCAGHDLTHATNEAYNLSQRFRVAAYVLTSEQVKHIFADQIEELHNWNEANFENAIALKLPLNFKKYLQ